jgi:hypothetical protein
LKDWRLIPPGFGLRRKAERHSAFVLKKIIYRSLMFDASESSLAL